MVCGLHFFVVDPFQHNGFLQLKARVNANMRLVYLRLVFTSDEVVVGVARRVERYDLVKIKPTESEAEH